MIGVIWNCRGVGKKGIARDIKNLLTETGVDFIGLQETMKRKYTDKFFRNIDSNRLYAWHWLPSQGRSGGILCGIKKANFDLIKVIEHEFPVEAEVWDKKIKISLRLVTIYGPAHEERREQFLRELSTICAKNDLPMIVGGDFNILRYNSEKNKTFYANRFSDMFNWIINSYGLKEITLNGGRFTWSNNHADPTLEKLDGVLMNDKWEVASPLKNLKKNPRLMSDHNPLVSCTDQIMNKKGKNFCFETSWIKHEDFLTKVKEIWDRTVSAKNATKKWYIKLGRIKRFLKGWGDNLRGHTKKYRLILKEELAGIERAEEEEILTATNLGRKHFIQAELMRLIEEEEMYWHKRSNENWLLKGDNNTGYFHRKANGKKGKILYSN
jgi:endonuclease/exonuclease/phosphatase family metal-dependent hydrolase